MDKKSKKEIPLCLCGCDEPVTIYRGKPRKYISGHNTRVENPMWDEENVEKQVESVKKFWDSDESEESRDRIRESKLGDKNPAKRPEVRESISKSCMGRIPYNKGLTKDNCESLQSASENLTGEKNHMYGKTGKDSPHYGKPLSKERRENISKSMIERGVAKLEKNPAWKGGVSFEIYPQEFNDILKESVRNRDKRICQKCYKTEKENDRRLDIHHIDYDKENNSEENLISLCNACNSEVNADRGYWELHFLTVQRLRLDD